MDPAASRTKARFLPIKLVHYYQGGLVCWATKNVIRIVDARKDRYRQVYEIEQNNKHELLPHVVVRYEQDDKDEVRKKVIMFVAWNDWVR